MNIGKTIADYRKAANMTQSEVADKLGVTYQAVSKWERDESLPDITMLPKIADLFNISIDTLLRGSFEIKEEKEVETVKQIIEEATESEAVKDEDSKEETDLTDTIFSEVEQEIEDKLIDVNSLLEQLAPLMKPNQLDRVVSKLSKVDKKLNKVYPFLKRERMSDLIEKMPLDELELDEMLPFLNSAQRDILIKKIVHLENVPKWLDLDELYPFLNADQKLTLLSWLLAYDRFDLLNEFLPFSNAEQREKIIDEMIETGNLNYVSDTYPYLNKELKNRLLIYFIENKMGEEVTELLEFM